MSVVPHIAGKTLIREEITDAPCTLDKVMVVVNK